MVTDKMAMDIPDYMKDDENNTADLHGLEEGDAVDTGWNSVKVVEVSEHGVRFSDGEVAAHTVVARNMDQTNAKVS